MPDSSSCQPCRWWRSLPLILWAGAIAWLSLTPSPPDMPGDLLGWDKAQHAAAYSVLAVLAARLFELYCAPRSRAWLHAALAAFGYGLALELAQGILAQERMADSLDLVANATGAFLAYASARLWFKETPR